MVEPVEEVTDGSSASFGNWDRTEFTFARMSDSAALGSVLSFMYAVMVELPSWLEEVMKSMLSACATACSSGWVMNPWIRSELAP